ncbi:hypothetical protein IHE55_10305 [Streptomyces pactum]|uniref:ABC transporter permease n=1 Tax=Streptomyces pactum TaxID=68249 RepID=A0ABS0NIY2_9ACTN|nr:hypothetical protein [Streptomyces pactum]MBH5335166.1 hypothetical protein [Streptomyces pactum]
MSRPERREDRVRRMLDGPPRPVLPPALADRAADRGRRVLRRRRAARAVGWWLLFAAVVAFTVWAVITEPWTTPPLDSTPVEGW